MTNFGHLLDKLRTEYKKAFSKRFVLSNCTSYLVLKRTFWYLFVKRLKYEQYYVFFPLILSRLAAFLARLYVSTGRAIAVTMALALAALLKMLKFLVKVFKRLYLLNPWMDLVGTMLVVRYWSEVLCCTITTHIDDLEVKVTDFEILC